jgi:N-acetylneuraminic acid mutarotase
MAHRYGKTDSECNNSLLTDGEGWEIYNPQDDSWTFLEWDADVLRNVAKFRCVGVGSKLYFLGGQRGGAFRKEVYVYDLAQARCVDGRCSFLWQHPLQCSEMQTS